MGQNQPFAWSEEKKKEQLTELGDQFLWNWAVTIFNVFIEETGPEKTLGAIRPHIKHSGMAQVQNAFKVLGKRGGELENLTAPWLFIYGALFGDDCLPVVIKETCAVSELRTCPISYSRPEICIALSHYVSEGWCEAINPDYEIVWTQHQTEGAPSCKFIVKRKDASLKALEREEEKARIPIPELREEMKNYIRYTVPAETGIILSNAFLEVSGSEQAIRLLRERMREWGHQVGPVIAKKLGIEGSKISDMTKLIDSFEQTIGQKGKVTFNEESACKEIVDCPLSSGPPVHCLQLESFLSGICEVINPEYEFTYDRMMTKGDKACHWMIRKKGELAKENANEAPSLDGPIERLTNKYIDGEITEEEFRKKLSVLKELKL